MCSVYLLLYAFPFRKKQISSKIDTIAFYFDWLKCGKFLVLEIAQNPLFCEEMSTHKTKTPFWKAIEKRTLTALEGRVSSPLSDLFAADRHRLDIDVWQGDS